ncbi:MAG: hypothetical protein ACE5GX_13470 [Thermoanaerobaculia bacterium]
MIRRTTDSARRLRRTASPARGSAYIISLMAMVVLMIIGLSLSVVTQTEFQISANEKAIEQTFYSADSGVAIGTARALTRSGQDPFTFRMNQEDRVQNYHLANRVNVSAFLAIQAGPCALCEINQGPQRKQLVNHAVSAQSERVGWTGSGPPPADPKVVARRTVSLMVDLQPWDTVFREEIFNPPPEEFQVKY